MMLSEAKYKQRCMEIFGVMDHDGWKRFEEDIIERKEALMERMSRLESVIEVGGVHVADGAITVVTLNKDPIRSEYKFLCDLQARIRGWREVAMGVIKENSK